ncbi:M56 family metallopeptidase [Streptococcus suis]|uniref:M56 family metallopeptidase n=1 Tax=Streptococcus suis TaxID=1307 RepID=UPI000CF480E3|nr:M56 family metallopeptidase [Streptococcus suis]
MSSLILRFFLMSLYKSALILVVSGLFILLKNRVSARVRYLTWLVLLASLIFPFRPRFGSGLVTIEHSPKAVSTAVEMTGTVASSVTASQPSLLDLFLGLPWLQIFLFVWFLGFVVVIGRSIFAYVKFSNLLKRWGTPISDLRILETFYIIKEEFGIKKDIRLFHYPQVSSPMIFGLRHPIVLLPATDYTDEELDLIFEHELTHYKHRDIYVNLLVLLVKAAHWFNPIVAFACKEVQEAAESYCDHSVLNQRDQSYRSFYGETIITMIHKSQQPVLLSSCFYSNKFNLKRRIIAIMDNRIPMRSLGLLVTTFMTLALVFSGSIFVVAMTEDQVNQVIQEEGLTDKQALEAALKDQNFKQTDVKDVKVTEGADYCLVEFSKGETRYHIQVDKLTKQVRKVEKETLKLVSSSSSTTKSSSTTTTTTKASSTATSTASSTIATTTTTTNAGNAGVTSNGSATTNSQAPASSVVETPVVTETPTTTYTPPATTSTPTTTYTPPATTYTPPATYTPPVDTSDDVDVSDDTDDVDTSDDTDDSDD